MPEVEEHLTCVYVEPVGTGDSGRLPDPDGYTVDAYTGLLHGIIEHLDQPQVYLLGHSYGGFVAQTYALRHPDRLAGLILYDTAAVAGPTLMTAATRNMEIWADEHREKEGAAEVAAAFRRLTGDAVGDERVRVHRAVYPLYLADFWGDVDKYRALQAARHLWTVSSGDAAPFDARSSLSGIEVPTLVIAGRHDFICGVSWADELLSGVPHAQGVTLENSGHFGHVEEPGEFAQAVVKFTG
jgi:proline iminopeptidase